MERVNSNQRPARRRLRSVALLLCFALLTLAWAEVGLRLASRAGILLFDVEMWRYAREVKRISDHPGVGLEHRPGVAATLMGVRVRTDGRGFRRAAPDLEALRTGAERIVAVVGDSCALGWGVPEGATLGEQLERTLDATGGHRFTVVNASVGNSNTAMEYARYLADVRPLHPAWVIVAFFLNDAEPTPRAATPLLVAHSAVLATLATRVPALLFRDYRSYYESLYAPGSAGLEAFQLALGSFGAALHADRVPGSLLLVPEMHEPHAFGPFAAMYHDVAALGTASGFEVVDPSADFAPGAGDAYWVSRSDSHPNARAHALLAAALARSPLARRLAPLTPATAGE